jgi:hypothetical protein
MMNQNQNQTGPSSRNDLGSTPTVAAPALKVVFEDPRFKKAPAQPSLDLPKHFLSLMRNLSQEESLLKLRRFHGLDNPRKYKHKLARLQKIDSTEYPYRRLVLDHWEKLVVIAATMVDTHLGNEDVAEMTLVELHKTQLSRDTILRDQRVVLEVIKLTDGLYLHWKNELALEVLVLMGRFVPYPSYPESMFSHSAADAPISILRQQSSRKFDVFETDLQQCKPFTETRDPIKLYIPFLVRLIRPNYSLLDIQKALGTFLFNESDWENFVKTSCGPDPIYDPIRDVWITKEPLISHHQQRQESTTPKSPIPVDKIKGTIGGWYRLGVGPI